MFERVTTNSPAIPVPACGRTGIVYFEKQLGYRKVLANHPGMPSVLRGQPDRVGADIPGGQKMVADA
jgi:hypothetical protein